MPHSLMAGALLPLPLPLPPPLPLLPDAVRKRPEKGEKWLRCTVLPLAHSCTWQLQPGWWPCPATGQTLHYGANVALAAAAVPMPGVLLPPGGLALCSVGHASMLACTTANALLRPPLSCSAVRCSAQAAALLLCFALLRPPLCCSALLSLLRPLSCCPACRSAGGDDMTSVPDDITFDKLHVGEQQPLPDVHTVPVSAEAKELQQADEARRAAWAEVRECWHAVAWVAEGRQLWSAQAPPAAADGQRLGLAGAGWTWGWGELSSCSLLPGQRYWVPGTVPARGLFMWQPGGSFREHCQLRCRRPARPSTRPPARPPARPRACS